MVCVSSTPFQRPSGSYGDDSAGPLVIPKAASAVNKSRRCTRNPGTGLRSDPSSGLRPRRPWSPSVGQAFRPAERPSRCGTYYPGVGPTFRMWCRFPTGEGADRKPIAHPSCGVAGNSRVPEGRRVVATGEGSPPEADERNPWSMRRPPVSAPAGRRNASSSFAPSGAAEKSAPRYHGFRCATPLATGHCPVRGNEQAYKGPHAPGSGAPGSASVPLHQDVPCPLFSVLSAISAVRAD